LAAYCYSWNFFPKFFINKRKKKRFYIYGLWLCNIFADWANEGQNPLHQFPRRKSVTSWRLPRNKSVIGLQHKQQVRNKSVTSWQLSPSTEKLRRNW